MHKAGRPALDSLRGQNRMFGTSEAASDEMHLSVAQGSPAVEIDGFLLTRLFRQTDSLALSFLFLSRLPTATASQESWWGWGARGSRDSDAPVAQQTRGCLQLGAPVSLLKWCSCCLLLFGKSCSACCLPSWRNAGYSRDFLRGGGVKQCADADKQSGRCFHL